MSQSELPVEEVHGIHGRKKLQKGGLSPSVPTKGGRNDKGAWMDQERKDLRAYEYLCHVGEAKEWIEACIGEEIPSITALEESLRYGVVLAKLARFFQPNCVRKIFEDSRLQFRHSDNTNFFFAACRKAGLPDLFLFELTDVYDKKNIPKVIYCVHALSHFLAKQGIAPKIKNLVGQLEFTDEDLEKTENSLKEAGVALPQFGNIEGALAKEMQEEVETDEQKRQKYLEEHTPQIVKAQSAIRGKLARVAYKKRMEMDIPRIVKLQALARRLIAQRRFKHRLELFKNNEGFIQKIQAHARGYLIRRNLQARRELWKSNAERFVKIQAHVRGLQARKAYNSKLGHFKQASSIASIVKVQALVRGKLLGNAYRTLRKLDKVPVKTVHSFIHLLDDSEKDFAEEIELENIKQTVIKRIKENNHTEQLLGELDVKIALLVRNRITLDEVLKTSRGKAKQSTQLVNMDGTSNASLSSSSPEDMFSSANLKSLDKESRHRLELYQNLFYILQTQPKYMAKLMFLIKQTKIRSFMDHVLLTLFNYGNSAREEFLLLQLFHRAIREEMQSVTDLSDFLRGNPVFIKMVVHYVRGAKERQYLRDLLQSLVKDVIGNDKLDLDTDPISIYHQLIKDEESRTGEKSSRPYDVMREDALKDAETVKILEEHVEALQTTTEKFLDAIIKNLDKMPYGIRCIAKQLRAALIEKFSPQTAEEHDRITRVIGNLVYYRYMNPAIVAPEGFDVIEQLVNPLQRKNLAEISKMLQQISVNRVFDGDQAHLEKLNAYLNSASARMSKFFIEVTNVAEVADHFQMQTTDMYDAAKTSKPVVYITPQEIFNVHALVTDTLNDIAPDTAEPIHYIMKELGVAAASTVTVDYSGVAKGGANDAAEPAGNNQPQKVGNEISLTLSSRLVDSALNAAGAVPSESIVAYKNLFFDTKRSVLSIIRVQTGLTLLQVLDKSVTEKDEHIHSELVKQEKESEAKRVESTMMSSSELPKAEVVLTFAQLKETTKANLARLDEMYNAMISAQPDAVKLQQVGIIRVSKQNEYQEMLTSIAADIRNKHRRRQQRRAELASLKKTIQNLAEKMKYLDEQKQSYQDYINSCMAQLTTNRKKGGAGAAAGGRFLMPFSPQWSHQQELKKQGKVPQFGSFKYGADILHKKGVLVEVDGYSPKQFDKITLTISSDETGVFTIEVSILGIKMPQKMELKLEDLLQYQFDNQQVIPLFDGAAKVNVNLLIFLINKKFYST